MLFADCNKSELPKYLLAHAKVEVFHKKSPMSRPLSPLSLFSKNLPRCQMSAESQAGPRHDCFLQCEDGMLHEVKQDDSAEQKDLWGAQSKRGDNKKYGA
jgi:hypothetical protein